MIMRAVVALLALALGVASASAQMGNAISPYAAKPTTCPQQFGQFTMTASGTFSSGVASFTITTTGSAAAIQNANLVKTWMDAYDVTKSADIGMVIALTGSTVTIYGNTASAIASGDTIKFSYQDGCPSAAQNGTYYYPSLFAGGNAQSGNQYVARQQPYMAWDFAGVDYGVANITPRASLGNPVTGIHTALPGCYYFSTGFNVPGGLANGPQYATVGGPQVVCSDPTWSGSGALPGISTSYNIGSATAAGGANNGWDFGANGTQGHGCIALFIDYIKTGASVGVYNNWFENDATCNKGPSYGQSALIMNGGTGDTTTNIGSFLVKNNYIHGHMETFPYPTLLDGVTAVTYQGLQGVMTYSGNSVDFEYNGPCFVSDKCLFFSGAGAITNMQVIVKYNVMAGLMARCPNGHGEFINVNGGSYGVTAFSNEDFEYNTLIALSTSGAACTTVALFDNAVHIATSALVKYIGNLTIMGNLSGGATQLAVDNAYTLDDGNGSFTGTCPACTYTSSNVPGNVVTITAVDNTYGPLTGPFIGQQGSATGIPISIYALNTTHSALNNGATSGVGSQWNAELSNVGSFTQTYLASGAWTASGGSVTIGIGYNTSPSFVGAQLWDGSTNAYVGTISAVGTNNVTVSSAAVSGSQSDYLNIMMGANIPFVATNSWALNATSIPISIPSPPSSFVGMGLWDSNPNLSSSWTYLGKISAVGTNTLTISAAASASYGAADGLFIAPVATASWTSFGSGATQNIALGATLPSYVIGQGVWDQTLWKATSQTSGFLGYITAVAANQMTVKNPGNGGFASNGSADGFLIHPVVSNVAPNFTSGAFNISGLYRSPLLNNGNDKWTTSASYIQVINAGNASYGQIIAAGNMVTEPVDAFSSQTSMFQSHGVTCTNTTIFGNNWDIFQGIQVNRWDYPQSPQGTGC
jgi:hypothetical protein